MGEMADWMIDQFMFPDFGMDWHDDIDVHYSQESIENHRKWEAENQMEVYKVAENTFSFEINSEKKIYRVMPPEARGSFMHRILEPQAFEEGDTKEWGCQLRWPMDSPEVQAWTQEMAKMFKQIMIDKFGAEKADAALQNPQLKIPLRNGNHESNEEYEGWLFMNVRNKFRQPVILGPHAKAIPEDMLNDSIIYSGAWYRSRLTFRYYDQIGKGIGAYLEILMKTRDDDRLDSVINVGAAEEQFSGFASPDAGMSTEETGGDIAAPDKGDGFDFL